MFYRFKPDENGRDNRGRTSEEAMMEHIEWCFKVVLNKEVDYDDPKIDVVSMAVIEGKDKKFNMILNALGNIKMLYPTYSKYLNSDNPKWNNVKQLVKEFEASEKNTPQEFVASEQA
jgi:hypothetical protein